VLLDSHGFGCKYRHFSQEQIQQGLHRSGGRSYTSRAVEVVPASLRPQIELFDPANAASDTSDGTLWPAKWLSREQVQHVLAECKRENVDFKTNPNLVYRFCDALLSANTNNPLWVSAT
jgi:hypothetical protein